MTTYRIIGVMTKPEVGKIVLLGGKVFHRKKILHAHLISPEGDFEHCVPVERLNEVAAAETWWDAQRIVRGIAKA